MGRKRQRVALGEDPPINSPFANLLGGSVADTPTPEATDAEATTGAQRDAGSERARPPWPSRLVLSRSRKKRRGKTVTQIDGLDWSVAEKTVLARQMGAALGCGTSVDDGAILLQGDQRTRAQAWLEAQGASRVVLL